MFGRRHSPAITSQDQTRALWDALRDQAATERERAEIDAFFSRQMP